MIFPNFLITEMCSGYALDLVFLVDSSRSIKGSNPSDDSYDNWELLKSFVTNMIDALDIGEDTAHVGLVSFSGQAKSVFYLNTQYVKSDIKDWVENLQCCQPGTNIAGALNEAILYQFVNSRGDRPNVPNLVVLLTDGKHSNKDPLPWAQIAHDVYGIQIISVGIGSNMDEEQLKRISSPPHQLGSDYFISDDFVALEDQVKEALLKQACLTAAGKFRAGIH